MKNIFLLVLVCIMISCSSNKGIANTDKNMKKVNVGMSRKKVVSILGEDYEILSSRNNTYVLGYKTTDDGLYKLVFVNDKLKEWNKEWNRKRPIGNHHHHKK